MPRWTWSADAFTQRWTRFIAWIGLMSLLLQAGATIVDVTLRYLFNAPVRGLSDLTELVIIFMVAACFPASLAGRHHISIRFLGRALPWRGREIAELWAHLFTLFVFVILSWQLIGYTEGLFAVKQTTWLLGIPIGPSWALTTALIVLCIPVQAVVVAIQGARVMSAGEPASGSPGAPHDEVKSVSEQIRSGAI